jgi:hypothetical protein
VALLELSEGVGGFNHQRLKKISALCNTSSTMWWREKKPVAGLLVWGIREDSTTGKQTVVGLSINQAATLTREGNSSIERSLTFGSGSGHFETVTANQFPGCEQLSPDNVLVVFVANNGLLCPNGVMHDRVMEYYQWAGTSALKAPYHVLKTPFPRGEMDASSLSADPQEIMGTKEQRDLVCAFARSCRVPNLFTNPNDARTVLHAAGIWGTRAANILFTKKATVRVTFWIGDREPHTTTTYQGLFHLFNDSLFKNISLFCANLHDVQWDGLARDVWTPFSEVAFREAILNAVLHAEYEPQESLQPTVRVDVWKNYLEITNSCHPAAKAHSDFFYTPPQSNLVINHKLRDALHLLHTVEGLGTGLPRIFTHSVMFGKHAPTIHFEPERAETEIREPATWTLRLYDGQGSAAVRKFVRNLRKQEDMSETDEGLRMQLTLIAWQGKCLDDTLKKIGNPSMAPLLKVALAQDFCPVVKGEDGILRLKEECKDLVLE